MSQDFSALGQSQFNNNVDCNISHVNGANFG